MEEHEVQRSNLAKFARLVDRQAETISKAPQFLLEDIIHTQVNLDVVILSGTLCSRSQAKKGLRFNVFQLYLGDANAKFCPPMIILHGKERSHHLRI